MGMVKIYRFRMYDISNDENRISRRWATREAISRMSGSVLEDTETEVDSSLVDDNGMTARDFDPHQSTSGFQTQVKYR